MTYAKDDPRSTLSTAPAARPADGIAAPDFLDFSISAPAVVTSAGTEQWIVRGQNFVLVYSQPVAGDTLFDASLARLSPAMCLICEVTRQSLEAGLNCDYMTGEQPYKIRMATGSMPLYRLTATSAQLAQHGEPQSVAVHPAA